jgi:hypothetical protein
MRRCPTTVGSANATRSVLITAYVLLDERRLIVPAQPRVTSVALVEHGLQLALVVTVDPPPNRWVLAAGFVDHGLAGLGGAGLAVLGDDGRGLVNVVPLSRMQIGWSSPPLTSVSMVGLPTMLTMPCSRCRWFVELLQSRVSSATAFFAQSSSTKALPAVAAAMSAAMAALLSARGRPRLALWRRAMASSATSGSVRPTSAR